MKKLFATKYTSIALVAFLALVFFAATSGVVYAANTPTQLPNLFSCFSSLGTCLVYVVSLTVNGIIGLFVALGALFVRLGLEFNAHVYDSPLVQRGFGVSLSIANLGFVLAIIIIAIATILRSETYGYKKTLWRLVVMAILVNFGLVITRPIVSFADSMTNYFIGATGGVGNYAGFVTSLTNAFAPQSLFTPPSSPCVTGSIVHITSFGLISSTDVCSAMAGQAFSASSSGEFWQSLMALAFGVVFELVVVLAFFSLAALLLVRYIWLGLLLVTLPLAWLMWIFPKFNHEFSSWWKNFIKWTFFPPAAMFFIYLAFITAAPTNSQGTPSPYLSTVGQSAQGGFQNASSSLGGQGLPETALAQNIGGILPIQVAADEVILCALMIGGLIAASSLTGKAGSFVVEQAKGVSGAIQGYAGKQAKKGARLAYQRGGGDKLNAALRRSRIPFASTIGVKATEFTKKGGADLVKAANTDLKLSGQSDDELVDLAHGTRGNDKRLAVLEELLKRNKLDKIDKIDGKDLAPWLRDNGQVFKDYGQGKLQNDINTALLSDNEMRRVAEVKATAGAQASTVDKYGVVGTAGAKILAGDLAGGARVVEKDAREAVDTVGANTIIDHHGRKVKAGDLLREARNTAKEAEALMDREGERADIVDEKGLLGTAGQSVKAGDLLRTASEKFWAGKDKGDVAKMKPGAIFGGQAKFGLDANTIKSLGKAITHGVATQTPTLVSSIAGKLDSWKQLNTFVADYKKSIGEALASGKMTSDDHRKLYDAITKVLGNKLVVTSEEQTTAAQTGGTQPPPPPPPPPPPTP